VATDNSQNSLSIGSLSASGGPTRIIGPWKADMTPLGCSTRGRHPSLLASGGPTGYWTSSSLKQALCAIHGHGHDSTTGPMLHVEGIEQLCKVTILNVEAIEKSNSTYVCIIQSVIYKKIFVKQQCFIQEQN